MAAVVLLGLLLAACASKGQETLVQPAPAAGTPPVTLAPSATNDGPVSQDGPTRASTPDREYPPPSPNPTNNHWVQERLEAVIHLYNLSDAGAALVRSLDVRQMRGEPGFFGSYGFKYWAGVGEAKPIGVIHELSHSYWGGFPVEGYPGLSWETRPGKELSPAMERYHSDILSFMAQPPDGFEVLRQRLRNLPELSSRNLEPLFHNLEGDLVYNTGGNLALVPPILRKYWSGFLQEGHFDSWYDAAGWFQSLTTDERGAASKYLGFEHLDLRRYQSIESPGDRADLLLRPRETLAREEAQRLYDLADQFDLLLGGPQKEENFDFWRGYLRDKVDMYRQHRDYLSTVELARATDLAGALAFMADLAGLEPRDRALNVQQQLPRQPFLVNFLPALDNPTLLVLFASGTPVPQGATLQATASFVQRLTKFSEIVDRILDVGRRSPQQGAAELSKFLEQNDFGPESDLKLLFELLGDADRDTASLVVQALDKSTFRRLIEPVPFHLRALLTPGELLPKLDISSGAELQALKRGIATLVEEPSGNFIVDEPFLHGMYQVIAARSKFDALAMTGVLQEPTFPLEGFIRRQPAAAAAVLGSDTEAALSMVEKGDPVVSPPARIMYRLIQTDPDLASSLVIALEERGRVDLVVASLAYIAYDRDRAKRLPGLAISLEQDGRFLEALFRAQGPDWLARQLGQAFSTYGGRAEFGQVSADFRPQFRATLEAAAATLASASVRAELQEIFARAAGGDGRGG